jgi:ethanolaminephosphotransferase
MLCLFNSFISCLFFIVCISLSFLLLLIINYILNRISNVYKQLKSNKKGSKDALRHIITFLIFDICIILWYLYDPNIWHKYPRIIQCTLGISFGEMVSRLILSHMSKEQFYLIQRPMIPLFAIVIYEILTYYNSFEIIPRFNILFGYLITTWISYLHFIYNIIIQLSTFLNINVFKIPYSENKNL